MAEPTFTADDDLPRTVRRQKQERERELAERGDGGPFHGAGTGTQGYPDMPPGFADLDDMGPRNVVVTRFNVPFIRLMMFFIKAVFAAIPALILLGALLWAAGVGLKTYYPQLVHMEIVIRVPK